MSNIANPASPAIVRAASLRSQALRFEPIATALGAEVHHVHLGIVAQDADLVAEIRRGLLAHKVLFFRDQDISPAEHVAFGKSFGALETHSELESHPDHPELVLLYRDEGKMALENQYHSDVSWRENPSMGSILRCVECPSLGGDTIWVNMVMAYERLPEEQKKHLEGLLAMHDIAHAFGGRATAQRREELRRNYPAQEHPVVRTHPETGERILFINQIFTSHFSNYKSCFEIRNGLDVSLNASAFMTYLFHQAMIPEYQVRLKWRPNTVAFWDNRSTQHYAVQDYYPEVRRMHRVTVVGDKPY